jgi:hypothetical protein
MQRISVKNTDVVAWRLLRILYGCLVGISRNYHATNIGKKHRCCCLAIASHSPQWQENPDIVLQRTSIKTLMLLIGKSLTVIGVGVVGTSSW